MPNDIKKTKNHKTIYRHIGRDGRGQIISAVTISRFDVPGGWMYLYDGSSGIGMTSSMEFVPRPADHVDELEKAEDAQP